MNSVNLYPAAAAISIIGVGKTATLRKLSALDQVESRAALLILKNGKGKVAKAAGVLDAAIEGDMAIRMIGAGDFQSFAVAYLGITGRNVSFGIKGHDGSWVNKPATDFRNFGAVLRHEHAQLGAKEFDSKGLPSAASAALLGLLNIHAGAVGVMDAMAAADTERRAALAAERIEQELLTLEAMEAAIEAAIDAECVAA